jgi:UDP-N-acetylglucosamine:LPS N-acetylglucosamine transferase
MVRVGAAEMVADADCTVAVVAPIVEGILLDGERLETMAGAAREAGRRDASARIVDLIEGCIRD